MQPGPRQPSKPKSSFSGFAPAAQKQPTQPVGPGVQQPNNPPIVPIAPSVEEVDTTLNTANYLLSAAITAVVDRVAGQLAKCETVASDASDCIGQAITKSLNAVYASSQGGQKVVADNLAYILSAAQQYAAQLGYPSAPINISGLPQSASRTADIDVSPDRSIQTQTVPIGSASGPVVPRDVGWQQGDIPYPAIAQQGSGIGQRYTHQGQLAQQNILLPSQLDGNVQTTPQPVSPAGGLPLPSGGAAVTTPGAAGYHAPGVPQTVPQTLGMAAGGPPSVGATPGLTAPSAGLSQEGPIFRGRNVASTLTETPSGEVSLIPPAQTGAIGGLGVPSPGVPAGGVGTPLDTGCPTSLVGLPTVQQLDLGQILPAAGMWITDGVCAYQLGTHPDPQGRPPVTANFPLNGVDYYGYLDPACPCNYGKTAVPIVQPAPPAPVPVQSCDNLPPNQANWTPWQVANCYQAPVTVSTCPAPVVTCPAPVVSLNLTELCNCLKALVLNTFPVPVDVTEPIPFIFSPDDSEWKRNAVAWAGKWAEDMNDAQSADDFADFVHKDDPVFTPSLD